jgi:hypothetical protein
VDRQAVQDIQAAIERAAFPQALHDIIVPHSGTRCKFDCALARH